MLVEEAQTATEAKCHCWMTQKGWGCHYNLVLHVTAPASTGNREGSRCSQLACPYHYLLHLLPRLGGLLTPIADLGFFLPERLLCSGNLWSRLHWEEHMQRWD